MSVGARPQLNRVMVRAKVFKGGRPPSTSVGQAKKSDSTMPCSPSPAAEVRAVQQVGGILFRQ